MGDQWAGARSYCPVCGMELAESLRRCRRCNWPLSGPLELWTPDRDQEDNRLMAQQREKFIFAAAAAAFVTATFDANAFNRDTQGLTAWGVEYWQLHTIRREYEAQYSQFVNECEQCQPALQELIENAPPPPAHLVFAEVNPREVQLAVLAPHLPAAQAWLHRDRRSWNEFLPKSLAEPPQRDLALAGGMAPALEQLQNRLIDYIDRQLAQWEIADKQPICLCFNISGWAALEEFAHALAHTGRALQRIPYHPAIFSSFDAMIEHALQKIPLRHSLALLTAQVDRTSGVVSLAPRVLFPKGTRVEAAEVRQMCIRFEESRGKRGILALVTYDQDPADYQVVQSWEVDIPLSGELNLRTALAEPGTVQLGADSTLYEDVAWDRKKIRDETPRNLTTGLDLALVLDGVASEAAWKERLKFAHELVEEFRARLGKNETLRVAVFAYRDSEHGNYAEPAGDEDPLPRVQQQGFNSASEALNFLGKLHIRPVAQNDYEAALEDALDALEHLAWGANQQRAVVTIGQRPPHPSLRMPRYPKQMINKDLDWERSIKLISAKARSWVVRCPLIWPNPASLHEDALKYSDRFWKAWGYTGLFELPAISPARLVETVLKVPQHSPSLRLPLLANPLEN